MYEIHVFLTPALVGGGWSASRPGGWVGPRTGLDDVEVRKLLPLPGLRTPDPLAVQPVASLSTDCAISALNIRISYKNIINISLLMI
jgi:hypothetical protein